ncbi:MAG: hypothetical protein ACLR2G_09385 [Phascolarctobacterium faecium]
MDIVICMGIRYPNWPGGHVSWKLILWFRTYARTFGKWFGDVLLVNPGSPVLPRGEMGATFAVLTVKEGERPEAEIYKL